MRYTVDLNVTSLFIYKAFGLAVYTSGLSGFTRNQSEFWNNISLTGRGRQLWPPSVLVGGTVT